jgi:hypothetical protein
MILEYLKNNIIPVAVAVAGFLSALVSMFINTGDLLSIKWLIFTIWLMLTIIILQFGFILKILQNKTIDDDNIKQLKLKSLNKKIGNSDIFLNQSNIYLNLNNIVKVYFLDTDRVENVIGIGIVTHIQENDKVCHIEFKFKNDVVFDHNNLYFSLLINYNELKILLPQGDE